MRVLCTGHHYHKNKDRTKHDIRDIGKALKVFNGGFLDIRDDGILLTWLRTYSNNEVISDINNIAQVLKITKNTYRLDWRDIE